MSQHDGNIANQNFPTFRSDLNDALAAILTNSSGATAPTTTFAFQWWYDTTNNTLKMRNADNDAWITIGTFDQVADTFIAIPGLTASATELNYLDGIAGAPLGPGDTITSGTITTLTSTTANITTGNVTTVNATTANITTVDLGNWTVTESAGVLYFKSSGVNKMKIDASGNLTVTGNITAYGTV